MMMYIQFEKLDREKKMIQMDEWVKKKRAAFMDFTSTALS